MLQKKVSYTFQEIIDLIHLTSNPQYPHQANLSSSWFTDLIGAVSLKLYIYNLSSDFSDNDIKAIINQLMTIVYNRHAHDYFYTIIEELEENLIPDQSDFEHAINNVLNIIELTAPKYIPILKQNKIYSTDPIAQIKSKTTGKSRFNDTPQNEGEFNDEEHATNVTESESESFVDSGSIMERLEAMFKGFRSIILEWSNEFNSLFYKEEEIA